MIGSMLTIAETWINITEQYITNLTKPDIMFKGQLLSTAGNPSKVFMYIKLGDIPVKYVIMGKRAHFLS